METAELTKPEQTHVERLSEPFAKPSMQEDFEKWAARSIAHSKEEKKEKEKNSGPREIKLAGRPEEEREFIEKVAQKDESTDSAKESRRESTEQRSDAKESEKPATGEANNSPREPLSGDRHWQAVEGKATFTKQEANDHWDHVGNRAGVALDYINKHPQKAQIEEGLRGFFDSKTPVGQVFFRDFSTALAEVPNPGEVLRHIALKAEDRNWLRSNVKNWKELRAAIQTISKHYAASSQASPKPRAPKPPSEVGGRGAVADDGTRGETEFSSFAKRQSQRYAR